MRMNMNGRSFVGGKRKVDNPGEEDELVEVHTAATCSTHPQSELDIYIYVLKYYYLYFDSLK